MSIIVADRALEATRTDSRNGLGKSTAIALVDFCLGANLKPHTRQLQGNGWRFTLTFTSRNGSELSVTRAPDVSNEFHVEGDIVRAGVVLADEAEGRTGITIGQRAWTDWLRREAFDRAHQPGKPPTFRSLIRHLVRSDRDSLIGPFHTMKNQTAEATHAENAYFLNLDWRFAGEWASLKERKNRLALADDPDEDFEVRIASLESQLVRHQRRAQQIAKQVEDFSVLPEYRSVESRVNARSRTVKDLANENIVDRQRLELYESQVKDEFTASGLRVEQLFEEAGIVLGEAIVRSLEEAALFQRQVAENRAHYLSEETRRIQERIIDREGRQARLAEMNEDEIKLLHSGGALDDLIMLQHRLAEAQAEEQQISERIKTLEALTERKAKLKSDELNLKARTVLDLRERLDRRAGIIARFSEIIETLYGEPAELTVAIGPKGGMQFKTKLPRVGSGGVLLMEIFAYDIAVSEDLAADGRGPGFLIHDSPLFADVDERQIAMAIEIAAESSLAYGYQYIAAMNSDKVPWAEFSDESVFRDAVVLSLHDGDPSGSLLGQRIVSRDTEPFAGDSNTSVNLEGE